MGDDQLAYFIFRGRDLESGETLSPYVSPIVRLVIRRR